MKNRYNILIGILLLSGLSVGLFFLFESEVRWLVQIFFDPKELRSLVDSYEPYGFIVLFGLQVAQVILAPLPGQVVGVAFGSVYGPLFGFIFGMIGNVVATVIVIFLVKKLGKPFVEKMTSEESVEKYEDFVGSKDVYPFIILVLMPIVSDDVVCYVAGLTKINPWRLIVAISIARAPGIFVLSVFGDSFVKSEWNMIIAIIVFVILFGLIVIWKYDEITDYLSKKYGERDPDSEELEE